MYSHMETTEIGDEVQKEGMQKKESLSMLYFLSSEPRLARLKLNMLPR